MRRSIQAEDIGQILYEELELWRQGKSSAERIKWLRNMAGAYFDLRRAEAVEIVTALQVEGRMRQLSSGSSAATGLEGGTSGRALPM